MTSKTDFLLTAITRDPGIARAAGAAGVDRVGVDIERLGKAERQDYLGARISDHELEDLEELAGHAGGALLFARVNPLHDGSRQEVDRAIALGARVIMLPYFRDAATAASFVNFVGGRAAPVLLVETVAATRAIREISRVEGVAEIMVGLNDLHRELGLASHFDVVVSGLMERIAAEVHEAGVRFGFGGLARVDDNALAVPPDLVCAQYARLGATSAWLARSFYNGLEPAETGDAVRRLRARLDYWTSQSPVELSAARERLVAAIRAQCMQGSS